MDPENTEQTPSTPTEQAAALAADAAAFEAGFNDEPTHMPTPRQASEGETPAPSPAPAAPAPAPAVNDPYADLPEDVRAQLARIPALEHENRSNAARVGALNSKLKQLRESGAPASAPTPSPSPPAQIESLERVRGELPEVARAIEDVIRARVTAAAPAAAAPAPEPPSPAPAPGADPVPDDEELALREAYPDWSDRLAGKTPTGVNFQLWLGRQPEDYRTRIMSTDKAAVVMAAFGKFDKEVATAPPPDPGSELAARRAARARDAATPRGVGARAPAAQHQQTDDEAFEAGFKEG